jgi:hypothetical protein
MKTSYFTEEDIVETEEYFQKAVVISSKQTESFEKPKAPKINNTVSNVCTSTKANEADKKFDQFLLEAIDETLSSLGIVVKNAILEHLKNEFQINKNDIPQKICDFSNIFHKVFGLGADRLELKILQNLSFKLQVDIHLSEHEWPLPKWIINDFSFTEYVADLRISYAKTAENKA